MDGKLVIFSAPSGAGKTTIVKSLLGNLSNLRFSVSATSRAPRTGEVDGVDYYFMSAAEFRQRIEKNEFTEWEEVYTDHYYGTLKAEIERIWADGDHVIFDVDVMGGITLKKLFGDRAISIFVMPPSIEALNERLRLRGTDSEEKIRMRIEKARLEVEKSDQFDHIILNDDLNRACREATGLVTAFLKNNRGTKK
ncbi:MAG: guanylate kinase [Bacteroidales bacterium]